MFADYDRFVLFIDLHLSFLIFSDLQNVVPDVWHWQTAPSFSYTLY